MQGLSMTDNWRFSDFISNSRYIQIAIGNNEASNGAFNIGVGQ